MISVNDVYRTVLAVMNKEQRGYVAADSFNYFAELAQKDIFEGYFNDLPHFNVSKKGIDMQEGYSNMNKNIREKIDIFSARAVLTGTNNVFTVPSDFYRLNTVTYTADSKTRLVEQISKDMIDYITSSPLTAPKVTFPKYIRENNNIVVYPNTITSDISLSYVRIPNDPLWASANSRITQQDPARSVDFELHDSEFYKLVYKILRLAGAQTREGDIIEVANGLLGEELQEEKE